MIEHTDTERLEYLIRYVLGAIEWSQYKVDGTGKITLKASGHLGKLISLSRRYENSTWTRIIDTLIDDEDGQQDMKLIDLKLKDIKSIDSKLGEVVHFLDVIRPLLTDVLFKLKDGK